MEGDRRAGSEMRGYDNDAPARLASSLFRPLLLHADRQFPCARRCRGRRLSTRPSKTRLKQDIARAAGARRGLIAAAEDRIVALPLPESLCER
jgi:hypothetical protein